MKLKHIAAAVALVAAAAGAQATVTDGKLGYSEALFTYFDTVTGASAAFDLGISSSQFLTGGTLATGTHSWNLSTGTNSEGLTLSYGSIFNTAATSGTAAAKVFSVIGLNDVVQYGSAPGVGNYFSTTSSSAATVASQDNSALASFSLLEPYLTSQNTKASQSGVANGAYFSLTSDSQFNTNWKNVNGKNWQANASFISQGAGTLDFYSLTQDADDPFAATAVVAKLGTFSLNATTGVLTYAAAAAVPEPSEYALMLSGLLVVGAIARRRAAK